MDFKIAASEDGLAALQMDSKLPGNLRQATLPLHNTACPSRWSCSRDGKTGIGTVNTADAADVSLHAGGARTESAVRMPDH